MTSSELIKLIPKWAKTIGASKAKRALIIAGVGISTADFMVRGEYRSLPGETMSNKIKRAMHDFIAELEAS